MFQTSIYKWKKNVFIYHIVYSGERWSNSVLIIPSSYSLPDVKVR